MKRILAKFEGGIGDCLLSNRFLFAIKEKHPKDDITVAFDTEGNLKQEAIMKSIWPSMYKNTFTLNKRKNPTFLIKNNKNQIINYPEHPNNMSDNFAETVKQYDKFYNLHISSLNFINYDFNWLNWYYHFPTPEKYPEYKGTLPAKFILVHLLPRPNSFHCLDQNYSIELVKCLQNTLPVVIVCEKEYFSLYKNVSEYIVDPTIPEVFDIASKCTMFFGADSCIRYIPLHFGKPTFVLSKHCYKPNDIKNVNAAHLVRWLLFRNNVLPFNCSLQRIETIAKNINTNLAYALFPDFSSGLEQALMDSYHFDDIYNI